MMSELRGAARAPRALALALGCPLAVVAALVGWSRAAAADTVAPTAEVVQKLRAYDPKTGDPVGLLQAVVSRMAPVYLKLDPGAEIQKGGPLPQVISNELLGKLDASPGDLPMVVYKKEDGRLPGAFIFARHRGVVPAQMIYRLATRDAIVRHPLVGQYFELAAPKALDNGVWGDGATRKLSTGFYAVDMPFGAGLFGLRPSYVLGDWESVMLPNGVGLLTYINRPARPDERTRMKTFQDKKDHQRLMEDDYYEAQEYRLSSLLIPERDESGTVKNTLHVYFVRIVPALKPGTDLKGSGPLARWLFSKGAAEALITPVKLIRDEVRRQTQGK